MELKNEVWEDISMKPDADMVMRKLAQNPSFCGLQKWWTTCLATWMATEGSPLPMSP